MSGYNNDCGNNGVKTLRFNPMQATKLIGLAWHTCNRIVTAEESGSLSIMQYSTSVNTDTAKF